jgi:type I restriction enzyme S subunit
MQGGKLKLSGKHFVEEGYPAFGAGGVNGLLEVAEFDETAIVLSAIGARCGKCFLAEGKWTSLANTRLIFPDSDRVDTRFLWYQLNDEGRWPRSGAAQPFIRPADVKSHEIFLPPLEEQKRIVAVLDQAFAALDRARANAEANLADAEELTEATFEELVTGAGLAASGAKSANSNSALINEQHERALDKKFRGPLIFSQSKFPSIPDDWVWASPEQLCSHIVDCLHATPKWTTKGKVCLRTTNFLPNRLEMDVVRFVSNETFAERTKRLTPLPGDVLYSREGGILGIACIIPQGVYPCLGQRMMQFRMREEYMLPEYFCSVLNSRLILKEVRFHTGGAAAPHLNIGDIRRFPIPVPPLEEQAELVERLGVASKGLQRVMDGFEEKVGEINDLRQSILQKAFAGELT